MPLTSERDSESKMGSARFAANDMLFELARKYPNVVVMTCDNSQEGTPLYRFSQEFGERFIDTGIAEQNTVGMAAGLALSGKKVFCQSFACFLTTRSIEFMYLDAAYNKAPIVFMGTHCGVTASTSGPTHFALMDIAYTRAMPNMTVIAPSDPRVSAKIMEQSMYWPEPIYLRLPKGVEPLVYADDVDVHIGKGILAKEGNDITLIGCGCGVYQCLRAAWKLEQEGVSARVLDIHTIKPIDEDLILRAAVETKGIVTCEDHMVTGGLGSAVAEVITASLDSRSHVPVVRLGVPDCYPAQGEKPGDIYKRYGYDADGVYTAAIEVLRSI